jgi:hypothetical protein
MDTKEALKQLPAAALDFLLTDLVSLKSRAAPGDDVQVPRITVALDSGHTFLGEVLAYSGGTPDQAMLLLRDVNSNAGLLDAVYIPLRGVRALKVHFNEKNLHVLAMGKPPAKTPSRLEVARAFKSLGDETATRLGGDFAVTVGWEELPSTQETWSCAGELLDLLKPALAAFLQDEGRLAAFKKRIRAIEVRKGTSPGVAATDTALQITVSLAGMGFSYPTASDLDKGLSAVVK